MKMLDRFRRRGDASTGRQPSNTLTPLTLDDLAERVVEALGGGASSGITVTPESAIRDAAYWTASIVLCESVAQLPVNVMRPLAGGGAEIAADTALHRILSKRGRPNHYMTSYRFRHLLVWHVLHRGDFYAFKSRVGNQGTLKALLPINPRRVSVSQTDDFDITYSVQMPKGGRREFTREDIFHVMGASDDGISGIRPQTVFSEALGLGIAQDKHAGKMFAHGARLGVLLSHPGKLSDRAEGNLREGFDAIYAGVENSHKTVVMEEGMTATTVAQNAEESQLLDSRKLQRSIIAGLRRVPAHMVGDLDKATFSNIENLARQFVDFSLVPWLEMIEQEADLQLLTEAEHDAGLYTKFNAAGLLRGNSKDRADLYASGLNNGWLNPNEVREKEDMNPYEGGDEFRRPMNSEPADQDRGVEPDTDDPAEPEPGSPEDPARQRGFRVV